MTKIYVIERYVDRKTKNWWIEYLGLDDAGSITRFRWGENTEYGGRVYSNGFVFNNRTMADRFLMYLLNIGEITEKEEFFVSEQEQEE